VRRILTKRDMHFYLRYDGDIGSGTDNHTFNLGVRLSW
jgi:outer membrane autotransporter protein